tara:strand:+ start:116 stop:691 length:576 start_codon:yes stop_codon:yes gene_type:complete
MIVVIDNFIKDENLLREIRDDKSFFSDPGVYYWWDGWWNNKATSTKQKLIDYIWSDNCPLSQAMSIRGFEYWTGIQTANTEMGFNNNLGNHYDKDETLFAETGEIVTPSMGTVYYPEQSKFEGGMLEIYTEGVDKAPEVVYAKPNRLVIFDAGKYVHAVTPVTSGIRKAIAINLWLTEPLGKQNGAMRIEG